ncbi:MAG: type II toxin-antitoxin system VapC family toxin [Candidatus Humimicrobiaceae bacterium]
MSYRIEKNFKQTEIGLIPEDWEVNSINNFRISLIDGDRGKNYPKNSEYFQTIYDSIYLSLAKLLNIQLITADKKLFNQVNDIGNIVFLSDYASF